jgi:hypothetical protein
MTVFLPRLGFSATKTCASRKSPSGAKAGATPKNKGITSPTSVGERANHIL